MKVTRTITRTVTRCSECPYFFEEQEMGATLHGCALKGKGYFALFDNNTWKEGIYNECRYEEEES